MSNNREQPERLGCLGAIFQLAAQWIGQLFGFGKRQTRRILEMDHTYRTYVDNWVSERLALWLHETRGDIHTATAMSILMGEDDVHPDVAELIRQTLIDAKVTFSQREGKQFLEIEAYMAPRQANGKQPQILRWRAEREIGWQEIPDDVRERLIRLRQPVTLSYAIPSK